MRRPSVSSNSFTAWQRYRYCCLSGRVGSNAAARSFAEISNFGRDNTTAYHHPGELRHHVRFKRSRGRLHRTLSEAPLADAERVVELLEQAIADATTPDHREELRHVLTKRSSALK
jgi:hypothetical protein